MTRKGYLTGQKQKGRRLIGVFPALYPKEILWAFNVLPVEIWDPPLKTTAANAHLQPYICSVARLGLELILQGKCNFLDGFLFPHTCDSIQNLASVVNDYVDPTRKSCFFYHPKASSRTAARDFYRGQLNDLIRSLEVQFGPLDAGSLRHRTAQAREISSLLHEVYDLRAANRLSAGNEEFYKVLRRGEYLFPDDLIPELKDFLARKMVPQGKMQIPVILSGILPNPPELLTLLDELGIRIAHDDLLAGSRRLISPKDSQAEPLEQITDNYFRMPPCPTRGSSIEDRRKYLSRLIRQTRAKGIIFNVVKFCEPEWFDVPNLRKDLKEKGIPSLVLDTELNQGLSGQMTTRVEAFVEMIS